MTRSAHRQEAEPDLPALQPAAFRRAMGQFATGITVVATRDGEGAPYGMTASSFGSLSLDPPLVQWSVTTRSFACPVFSAASYFSVNILASEQEEVSRTFTRPIDRFGAVSWETGLHDLPLIHGCLAWIECALEVQVPAGDHTILIGRVERAQFFDRTPLLFWRGSYMPVQEWEAVARTVQWHGTFAGPKLEDHLCLM